MKKWTDKPLIIKPNAGLPCLVNDKTVYNITNEEFASAMEEIMSLGVNIVGGCCGTNPDMLKFFFDRAKNRTKTDISVYKPVSAVCSPGKTVVMDGGKIIEDGTPEELLKTNEYYRAFAQKAPEDREQEEGL